MLKFYSSLFFLFCSCAPTTVNYIGSKSAPVQQVDVYVSRESIQKPYDVVGRGFVKRGFNDIRYEETMQREAIKIAKQTGADAVLFLDFAISHPPSTLSTTTRTDSVFRGTVSTSEVVVGPTTTYGFDVLFLKYKKTR